MSHLMTKQTFGLGFQHLLLGPANINTEVLGFQHLPRDPANVNTEGLGFQHLPRDPANVNTRKSMFDRYYFINITKILRNFY